MSIRRDYIVQLARRVGTATARAIGFRAEKKHEEAQAQLTEAFRELTGLSLDLAQALSAKDLVPLLSTAGLKDTPKVFLAALLLGEAGAGAQALALCLSVDDFKSIESMDPDLKRQALATVERLADERLNPLAAVLRA
jgi:hypothetical protein